MGSELPETLLRVASFLSFLGKIEEASILSCLAQTLEHNGVVRREDLKRFGLVVEWPYEAQHASEEKQR